MSSRRAFGFAIVLALGVGAAISLLSRPPLSRGLSTGGSANSQPEKLRFDLTCEGQDERGASSRTRLRIDLSSGYYCQDDCHGARSIKAVSADQLLLAHGPDGRHMASLSVTREATGALRFEDFFSSNYRIVGTCIRAPFTTFAHPAHDATPSPTDLTLAGKWAN
jgi:hypothetical protein